jgi:DNA-binding PadR family transcriptional regulator
MSADQSGVWSWRTRVGALQRSVTDGQPMHKTLHLLGLLLSGPKSGYDLHRIVAAHGELFTDLKKGNVYYLLERLAHSGALQVTTEAGARGPRRERLIYSLTERGRQRFHELLREVVRSYDLAHTGVEVGMIFLPYLDPDDAIHLLEERRQVVLARRAQMEHEARMGAHLHEQLALDHLLSLMDAEVAWSERSLQRLRERRATH